MFLQPFFCQLEYELEERLDNFCGEPENACKARNQKISALVFWVIKKITSHDVWQSMEIQFQLAVFSSLPVSFIAQFALFLQFQFCSKKKKQICLQKKIFVFSPSIAYAIRYLFSVILWLQGFDVVRTRLYSTALMTLSFAKHPLLNPLQSFYCFRCNPTVLSLARLLL